MYQSIVPTQPGVSGNLESYWVVQYIPSELAEIYHRRKKMSSSQALKLFIEFNSLCLPDERCPFVR